MGMRPDFTRAARVPPRSRSWTMSRTMLRLACVAAARLCHVAARLPHAARARRRIPGRSWRSELFNGRPLADGTGLIAIEMPARAEDAAIVPVTVRATLPPGDTRRVKAFTIVIDENPAPLAATFNIGPNAVVSVDLDPRARQFLHQRACRRRAQRRQALRGQDLCEGLGRLFGARRPRTPTRPRPASARCGFGNSPDRPRRARAARAKPRS